MTDVFNLSHIFVVFHPGAAGNFISTLIRSLMLQDNVELSISSSGSCHLNSKEIKDAIEYFSCGIFYIQQANIKPHTFDRRVEFYKDKLLSLNETITKPVVTWTHDFTNIPLYRTLFPNCKILVITQESITEKLVITSLQQMKNILVEDLVSVIPDEVRNWFLNTWTDSCRSMLCSMVGNEHLSFINTMLNDRFNAEYKDILTYASVFRMLDRYDLLPAIDNQPCDDKVNYVSYSGSLINSDKLLITVKPYNECIDDNCVILPYRVIMNNDTDILINVMNDLIGELSVEQKKNIVEKLHKYVNSQPKELLENPIEYLQVLKQKAILFSEHIKSK